MKLDLCYVDEWTPMLDVRILFRTVWVVLTGKGAR
jgi:lipopolysaccharide/colanic/teichoic acid biosynthesis glycosyltransferase